MTSPILLGGTQVAEHGLSVDQQNTWGGWSGTFGVGGIALFTHGITIKNPKGAYVYGFTTMTSWAQNGGQVYGGLWIDGTYTSSWGGQAYPYVGYHTAQSWEWWTGALAPGSHTLVTGLYVINNTVTFDGNDGGTSLCWEQP